MVQSWRCCETLPSLLTSYKSGLAKRSGAGLGQTKTQLEMMTKANRFIAGATRAEVNLNT